MAVLATALAVAVLASVAVIFLMATLAGNLPH